MLASLSMAYMGEGHIPGFAVGLVEEVLVVQQRCHWLRSKLWP